MKKYLLVIFFLLLVIIYFIFKTKSPCKNKETVLYKLENKNYCLLVADNNQKWAKGLMNYKKPVDFDGMIFIFSKKERLTFWNMNTYLDLDLYWLDDEKVVGQAYLPSIENTKSVNYVTSQKPVNKVIEIIK